MNYLWPLAICFANKNQNIYKGEFTQAPYILFPNIHNRNWTPSMCFAHAQKYVSYQLYITHSIEGYGFSRGMEGGGEGSRILLKLNYFSSIKKCYFFRTN